MSIFYKPEDGWAGDFIPFYWEGYYHLFYLKDYRNRETYGEGTPWFHLATRDFVNFVDYGEALPRGRPNEQDLYVFTGCVYEHQGQFHIFYTGHNPHFHAQGKPEQAVMHATSGDLIHWEKDPTNPILFADPERYEWHDWRDPFVYWNEEEQAFWMLLAARVKEGPNNRRGVTALATSKDLVQWEVREPFWAPNLYYTHECPDLFRIGEWWYQVYSTFSERVVTHYRMSCHLAGPWTAPANDTFDGRAFYAAKTAGDSKRRFVFGWNPTRTDSSDTGNWNWGGNLVVHEIFQQLDGALHVGLPPEIRQQFLRSVFLTPEARIGQWTIDDSVATIEAEDGFAWCRLARMPPCCYIEGTIQYREGTRSFGFVLRADDTLDRYYLLKVEPGRQRIVFERWPRPGDEPPIIERPLQLSADSPVHLRVLVEDSIIVAYANDCVALSTRGYEHTKGDLGLFINDGAATFIAVQLME